ncbi:uncharacterized protein LOC133791885 [Humulus lupulus]|uniref:uncharacterized protein LOC133791885 n=1 Tax=Humulus lupulus TaxID=3486 RepID=UPI002B410AB2|nr:uncharacterized protein LOC133791885 [Humulus lupulus]
MGQLATLMSNHAQGNLPSTIEVKPKEQCQAITLRSGKRYEDLQIKEATPPISIDHHIKVPYPQRLRKNNLDKQFSNFLEALKKLHINIPFAEALEKMPSYVKFMKDILSKKRKMGEYETVALTKECSAIQQRKLPQKLRDHGSFTIPCTIGNIESMNALCDLGATINLMPLSVFRRLKLGEARLTMVTLQLADRSLAHPRGIIEDVLVKVDKFIFPSYFIVLDMEEDTNVPLILGRSFLAIGQVLIDVQKGELKLRVQSEEVVFNVLTAMNYSGASDSFFSMDVVESLVDEKKVVEDPLELSLIEEEVIEQDGKEAMEYAKWLNSYGPLKRKYFEELGSVPTRPLPSVEKMAELELKKLLRVLRMHMRAIGWTLADIKGISPSIVMHRILMEDGIKPTIDAQRRLNPPMKEVVRKEVVKWLDAGVAYPISDSSRVSPVQVVSKKGGMTVVKNENNELIPTLIFTSWMICIDY